MSALRWVWVIWSKQDDYYCCFELAVITLDRTLAASELSRLTASAAKAKARCDRWDYNTAQSDELPAWYDAAYTLSRTNFTLERIMLKRPKQ